MSIKSIIKKITSSQIFKVVLRICFLLAPLLMIASIVRDTTCSSPVITVLSVVLSSIAGFIVAFGRGDAKSAMHVVKGLGIALGVPLGIHLIGTYTINNFGGLGGSL